MPVFLILLIYNLLYPVIVIIGFPAWVVKMWKRGGYGTGLMQRLAWYGGATNNESADQVGAENKGVVYIHAVSVGEVFIATKLVDQWLELHPEEQFVIAATTATGHEVARAKAEELNEKQGAGSVRVIYSPLDFGWMIRSVFRRFRPQQIILIEAEVWPNFLMQARRDGIMVSIVNARLSKRSEARFEKFGMLIKPIFGMLDRVCTQNEEDAERFAGLGISSDRIHSVGSMKFDSASGLPPQKREAFQAIIDGCGKGRKVVLAVSTHAGEEKLIGEAFLNSGAADEALLIIAPRHAERRAEVVADMKSVGFAPLLKTELDAGKASYRSDSNQLAGNICLITDTTGELRDWTAHADIAVIGKSFLGKGGQNPVEAIIAGVPVICGAHMGNFEPLVSQLISAGGVVSVDSEQELAAEILSLLHHSEAIELTNNAEQVLTSHQGAVVKTVELLHL